jgi:hypothetical protein
MQFVKFMTSSRGRAARVIAGFVILTVGLAVVQGTLGLILALIALVPSLAACSISAWGVALGYPFRGADAPETAGN